jgi:uroporphyrinogen decarboxylase
MAVSVVAMFEKVFPTDILSKRERVERALNFHDTDRVPLHDQLSFNPGVIGMITGRSFNGFTQTVADIGEAVSKTLDCCFPVLAPCGTSRHTDESGFVWQNDNWTSWHISRPFADEHGARDWMFACIQNEREQIASFNANVFREHYHAHMRQQQKLTGETVVMDYSIGTGFCYVFDMMGLEIFTFFQTEYPDVLHEAMELSTAHALLKINAAADTALSPVVLVAEDFATKQGPIFSPEFLRRFHFPFVKRLADAWKNHGLKVLYHSDGNYKRCVPDLVECGVDGFYCLEPNCGMDIVELKKTWPRMVWAGGVDGVDLLERGTPGQVSAEVRRHIAETNARKTGGMLVGSSSEINPGVKPENFKAMVDATREAE